MEEIRMKITDIENKRVKISSHSITVRNDSNKTCGVVNNVKPFKELRTADQMTYFKGLKECGIFGDSDLLKCFVICDGEPYYLHNLKPIEFYEEVFKGRDGWESEERRYNERKQAAEKVSQIATVIPCYVLQ